MEDPNYNNLEHISTKSGVKERGITQLECWVIFVRVEQTVNKEVFSRASRSEGVYEVGPAKEVN